MPSPTGGPYADRPALLTAIMVAALDSELAYGTPSSIVRHTKITITPKHNTDKIVSAGVATDTFSVLESYEGEIEYAALNNDAFKVMTGFEEVVTGTDPVQTADITITGGAKTLPYFGMIGEAQAADDSNRFYGLYRCMLTEMPEWEIANEGKFVVANAKFIASALDPTSRKLLKTRGNQTATPITAGLFTTWLI